MPKKRRVLSEAHLDANILRQRTNKLLGAMRPHLSDPDEKLFKFGRHRAWQIVRFITGKWCHYFRSQGESWYGKIFSNIFGLKDFVGVVDASTLSDYVKTDWKDYRDRILGKT